MYSYNKYKASIEISLIGVYNKNIAVLVVIINLIAEKGSLFSSTYSGIALDPVQIQNHVIKL